MKRCQIFLTDVTRRYKKHHAYENRQLQPPSQGERLVEVVPVIKTLIAPIGLSCKQTPL